MAKLPERKHPRLKEYDYGSNGAYFVTVCVKNRAHILSRIARPVGRDAHIAPTVELLSAGYVLEKYIHNIGRVYPYISVEKYVIMPNHFHLLLLFDAPGENGGMRASRPTLPTVIRSLKTMVTKELGCAIFQSSFHDHVIRDDTDYLTRWRYIDENPAKWPEDEYYSDV